jgi:hypothetical protein
VSEEVEVIGVGMTRTAEPLARLATAGPRALEPIEPAAVEHDRALGTLACRGRVPVPRHQDGEACERREHPRGRWHAVAEGEPAEHAGGDHAAQPQAADELLAANQAGDRLATRGEASRVLGVRVAHRGPG